MRRVVGIILGVLAVVLALISAGGPHSRAIAAGAGPVRPDVTAAVTHDGSARVNVTLTNRALPGAPRAEVMRQAHAAQASVLARLGAGDFDTIYQYDGISALTGVVTPHGLSRLANDPDVRAVTLDQVGSGAALTPPATAGEAPEHLSHSVPMIRADLVHQGGITGAGVTVAILDSGADTHHPDLADSIAGQECFLTGAGSHCPNGTTRQSGPGAAEDDLGHGSNVAGIVTSNGVVSSIGVAPGADVLLYKILNSSNQGQLSDWDAALSDIIANHPEVRVINMSLVSFITFTGDCSSLDPTEAQAFQTLTAAGVAIFVSSGNNGAKSMITFPACLPGAISVGAVYDQSFGSSTLFGCTDSPATTDTPTCWSNSRPDLKLLAPGSFIISDGLNGGLSDYVGTSQASPHAAGTAALVLEHSPSLTRDQLVSRLTSSGVMRTDPANGVSTPRIDAYAAVFSPPSVGGFAEIAVIARPSSADGFSELAFTLAMLTVATLIVGVAMVAYRARRSGTW
ncbi:MAG TPA: S8 family serine peptidase [Dehalococcoidia bacterium]|nr:S8 family serine peptidase [Dehalococcoidia bacterium]